MVPWCPGLVAGIDLTQSIHPLNQTDWEEGANTGTSQRGFSIEVGPPGPIRPWSFTEKVTLNRKKLLIMHINNVFHFHSSEITTV